MSESGERTGARVGVLVVTHGECARGMIAAVVNLVGPDAVRGFEPLHVTAGEDRDALRDRIDEAVRRADAGAGVLIVCDLAGSTAANCCLELKRSERGGAAGAGEPEAAPATPVEVLCGVSLPMLVKLASADRLGDPAELARAAAETAARSIRLADGGRP